MSESDLGCVKTLTFNLRVEFPSRFRRCGNQLHWQTSVGRRQLRKQFCASLGQACFHTASTHLGNALTRNLFRKGQVACPRCDQPAYRFPAILLWAMVRAISRFSSRRTSKVAAAGPVRRLVNSKKWAIKDCGLFRTHWSKLMNRLPSRLPALDGWRGISILCVLAGHMLPLGPKFLQFNEMIATTGMSLFFILSGFLIVSMLVRNDNVASFL